MELKFPVFPQRIDEFAVKEDAVPIATPFPLEDAELPETELYVIVLLRVII